MEVVLCPSCGEENPAKFRLCGYCGTPLASDQEQPPPPPPAPTLPPREIRKTVTLVFTDIKDSTALTGSIDAEAMNEIKARYFSAMGDQIREHGGEVEKNIGDAIMAVFGRIRAHEDDALRAVRAAHGMQAVLAQINEEFQRSYGVQITNRTGVNTGEIVANTDPAADQNLATGDAVNVAARLEQNAPAGEVLIGEITYALVAPHVDVERLDLVLKGKPDPVPAYRLIDVHDAVAAPDPDEPMVGRSAELTVLREAYDAVVSTGRPRLLVISGDAGVGKTRLIADFVREHSTRALVLRGRCLTYGKGITFWPLVEIVRSAAQILEADPVDTAQAKIASLLPEGTDDPQAVVDRVGSAIGLSTGDFPVTELIWGARKLLEAQTADRPLIVVVDDIHWAEATFLDLLDQLVASPTPAPILVLCSSRTELAEAHPDWWADQEAHRLELAPLGAEAVEAIIDRLLGDAALPPEARERVVTAADGNPLYVEQIVSMLRDRDPNDATIDVPPTITALLAARLDALSRQERAVIEPASVIGLSFPAPAIGHLVPPPLQPEVGTHLEALSRKHLIRPSEAGDTLEEDAYRFHHVLVKDATYQSLLKRARAQLHEQFAEWAEPLNRERGRELEFEEIVAYHLEQAVRYRSELGPLDDHGRGLAERAATRLSRSGLRALDRSDTPAAVTLLQRAVALMDDRDPRRLELVPELGEALMALSRFEEAAALLDEAATSAQEVGDARLSSRIRVRRLALELFGEESSEAPAGAESEARELLSTLTALGDHGGAARAWRLLLLIHGNAGQYDELATAAQHLIEEAGRANEPRLVRQGATGYAIGSVLGSTPVTEALDVCRGVLTEVGGDRRAEAIVCGALAQLHAMQGDFAAARQHYRQEVQLLSDLDVSDSASTSIDSARVEMLAGDLDAAEQLLRRDDAELARMGERYFRSTVVGMLARVLLLGRRSDEAEGFVILAETLSDADDASSQVLWRSTRARLLAEEHPHRALTLARQSVELALTTTDLALQGDTQADLAEVLLAQGDAEGAHACFVEALELYERKGDSTSAAAVTARLGQLAESGHHA